MNAPDSYTLPPRLDGLALQLRDMVLRVQERLDGPPDPRHGQASQTDDFPRYVSKAMQDGVQCLGRLKRTMEDLTLAPEGNKNRLAQLSSACNDFLCLIGHHRNTWVRPEWEVGRRLLLALLERPLRQSLAALNNLARALEHPEEHLRDGVIRMEWTLEVEEEGRALDAWLQSNFPRRNSWGLLGSLAQAVRSRL